MDLENKIKKYIAPFLVGVLLTSGTYFTYQGDKKIRNLPINYSNEFYEQKKSDAQKKLNTGLLLLYLGVKLSGPVMYNYPINYNCPRKNSDVK